ncbi:hypothetical protein QEH42_gp068 [Microbacterium phage Pumpernickel]|uniref:Uncharacterized protein n=1 Tax=Microbacterium phage Pumpernickel TaxID=2885983 RepID=A0AAE9C3E4_9CAUD|nr:hypothetical protein QEH42_gp068 [Microbacterium phage Pumpernickel]UDL15859.1 hypothetical protein SEA_PUMPERNICKEL_68 [Microbacterium phage Pumpernickel]
MTTERFRAPGGKLPSDAERAIIADRRRNKRATEYVQHHSGGMQPVESIGDRLRSAYEAGWNDRESHLQDVINRALMRFREYTSTETSYDEELDCIMDMVSILIEGEK